MQKITPDDIRYADLAQKRFNKRFQGQPHYIFLPTTTQEVIEALQYAVDHRLRPVVRSGGHCLEGFVSDPSAQVLIDTSLMTSLSFDELKGAFAIEAGVTVGEMYRRLFLNWGVVLPAGEHPGIGVGGHILGGAFGFLCREYGLAADYLFAVEVVTVNAAGKALSTIATRQPGDPHHELWWAHTGAGGGNFGIVTRYWVRNPQAVGSDPFTALPKAPSSIITFRIGWEWKDFDETSFAHLVRNFGTWAGQNSAPDSRFTPLCSFLFLNHRNLGKIEMKGLATGPLAAQLIGEHLDAVATPIKLPFTKQLEESGWLRFALNPFPELFQPGSDSAQIKVKDAFFRNPLTDAQIATAWQYLTANATIGGGLAFATYGGKVNEHPVDATASAQRDSIMDVACNAGWIDPQAAAPSLDWVRNFYKDLFADTGGVPIPCEQTDGAMINHPDTDLSSPLWNQSGVPWYSLYYKQHYPRLQQVKADYDPLNIFHHALSIKAAK
ncbi:FAD-binding oxidoreductase [Paraflavitalea sp. CAU 1676]|uniref:FAD-binding oxidoreductase n=1 Tax=Paraflavitalea sp. CAU 1676 TaxID=3032598 RepID=UPI0023DA6C8E|nr:FAD-binding oxidoreductase [Paraflavitalea sp. CAU 1676]MDF2193376.1 FAD-binding oxidoreductase [Paraflavitalea sp. CAU 1676]